MCLNFISLQNENCTQQTTSYYCVVKTFLKSPLFIKQFSTEYLKTKNQRIPSWQTQSIQTIQWTNQTTRGKHSGWRKAQENVCVRDIISFGFASDRMTMVGDHSLNVVMQNQSKCSYYRFSWNLLCMNLLINTSAWAWLVPSGPHMHGTKVRKGWWSH